jgi:protein-tyrosine-phosphatase
MAEAIGKKLVGDVLDFYSAGTEVVDKINQDAVRLIKEKYQVDMEETQKSKLVSELPRVDIVVTMGCNVNCPYLPSKERYDWGLDDPSGKSDEEFLKVIEIIEKNVKELAQRFR